MPSRLLTAILVLLPLAAAFAPLRPTPVTRRRAVVTAVAPPMQKVKDLTQLITVTGNNVHVTDSMNDHVNKRLENVISKHRQWVKSCEVHFTVIKNPRVKESHTCEVTLSVKPGMVIKSTEKSESMYAAVDLCASSLKRKMRKYKERKMMRNHHESSSMREVAFDAPEADESAVFLEDEEESAPMDEYAAEATMYNEVMRKKSFDMQPISVDEAVLCLNYIDHDFYVFRNIDTKEINVVYKRNHGGVGHIEPE